MVSLSISRVSWALVLSSSSCSAKSRLPFTNPSYHTELNSANLIYERVDDRLAWQI